jgi:predicted nucleic acid-binding protein
MNPTFLIDTNIIIQFEDTDHTNQIKPLFSKLHSLFVKHSLKHFYHPSSESDFESDQDEARKIQSLSRLRKYPLLESPPVLEIEGLEELFGGVSKSNDLIDCQILYSLKRNCVTYLVSEDQGIRKRARKSGIEDRVLNCKEAIELLERVYEEKHVDHPRINLDYCYNLDIKNQFFDSLRDDYPGFDKWYLEKCCQKHRKCWVIKSGEELAGICIYKPEDLKNMPAPGLKMCTFKISSDFEGRKYGELVLRVMFLHSIKNNINTLWVTTYSKQEKLIYFLKSFGFRVYPSLSGEELIFYKEMFPPSDLPKMNPLDFHIRYYPHYYDSDDIEKYFIPIKPDFYKILFPENEIDPQMTLLEVNDTPKVPGNTIKKVYLSHSNKKSIPAGSLLFFYVSAPNSAITTIAIVEKTERYSDEDSLSGAIGKRSVYTNAQVSSMIKKEVLVISFRIIRHFDEISLEELRQRKVLKSQPQTIGNIQKNSYKILKKIIKFSD